MLSADEAAAYLGIKRESVTFAARVGRLAAQKIDGHWFVDESEVIRYQRDHCCPRVDKRAGKVARDNGGKRCSKCQEWKPFAEFVKDPQRYDGHHSRCKACHNKATHEQWMNHTPEVRAHKRAVKRSWYARNREQHREYQRQQHTKQTTQKRGRRILNLIKRTPGYVYLARSGGYYKIGITKRPKQRTYSLRNANPFGAKIIYLIPTDYTRLLERQLHEQFHDKRMHGEWFSLIPDDVERIKHIATQEKNPCLA